MGIERDETALTFLGEVPFPPEISTPRSDDITVDLVPRGQGVVIQPTAIVEAGAILGKGVKVWHYVQVRSGAVLGEQVSIGMGAFIDTGVTIGRFSRVQNGAQIYQGVTIGEWCFVGPNVTFTNDRHPRIGRKSWKLESTTLANGASIGAGAVVLCGIKIGEYAIIGTGSVVRKDVEPFTVMVGAPARAVRRICACGDSVMPVSTPISECLRGCCKQNLLPESYALASSTVRRLTER